MCTTVCYYLLALKILSHFLFMTWLYVHVQLCLLVLSHLGPISIWSDPTQLNFIYGRILLVFTSYCTAKFTVTALHSSCHSTLLSCFSHSVNIRFTLIGVRPEVILWFETKPEGQRQYSQQPGSRELRNSVIRGTSSGRCQRHFTQPKSTDWAFAAILQLLFLQNYTWLF